MTTLFERAINTVERHLDDDCVPPLAIIFGSFVCKALTFDRIGDAIQVQSPDLFSRMERAAAMLDYGGERLFAPYDDAQECLLHLKMLHKTLGDAEDFLSRVKEPPIEYQAPVRLTRMQVETALRGIQRKIHESAIDSPEAELFDAVIAFDPEDHPLRPSITYISPRLVPAFQKAAMYLGAITVRHYVSDTQSSALKAVTMMLEKSESHVLEFSTPYQNKARVIPEKQVFKTILRLRNELERLESVVKYENLRDLRHFFKSVKAWSSLFLDSPEEKQGDADLPGNVVDIRTRQARRTDVKTKHVLPSP